METNERQEVQSNNTIVLNAYQEALDLLFSKALPNFKDGDSSKYKSRMLLQELVDKYSKEETPILEESNLENIEMTDYEKQFKDLAQKLVGSITKNNYQIVYKDVNGYNFGIYESADKYFINDGQMTVCELTFYGCGHNTEISDLKTLKKSCR